MSSCCALIFAGPGLSGLLCDNFAGGKEDGSCNKPKSPVPSPGWAGGHAYSRDGLSWSSWTRCYNTSVALADGTTVNFPRRERPKLLFDKDGTPTHLYNGQYGRDMRYCSTCELLPFLLAHAFGCASARRYSRARDDIYDCCTTQRSCQQTTLSFENGNGMTHHYRSPTRQCACLQSCALHGDSATPTRRCCGSR